MARLNPRRRWLAKQTALQAETLATIRLEHGPKHDDMHLLQQGHVKSHMAKFKHMVPGKAPRAMWESNGIAKRTSKARWSQS